MASGSYSTVKPRMGEEKWVEHVSSILEGDNLGSCCEDIPVCIFKLPESITGKKPEAYTPRHLALGPYHHFQPKLYQKESYKLSRALVARKHFRLDSKLLRKVIMDQIRDIRACYHEHLEIDDATLSWMMVVDGLVLLSIIYHLPDLTSHVGGPAANSDPSSCVIIIQSPGRKKFRESSKTEVFLLENQIPNIVLRALLSTSEEKRHVFSFQHRFLVEFCTKLSPIELQGELAPPEMAAPLHVLDALHQLVWLGARERPRVIECCGQSSSIFRVVAESKTTWIRLREELSKINVPFIAAGLKVVDFFLQLLELLGISPPADLFSEEKLVLVPSASCLSSVGVKFCRLDKGAIKDILFDKETGILKLPVFNFRQNDTEAVIRNLLAYEATAKQETPKFTCYIELMCALIQSDSDVQVLKNAQVVKLFADEQQCVGSNDTEVEELGKVEKAEAKAKSVLQKVTKLFADVQQRMGSKDKKVEEQDKKIKNAEVNANAEVMKLFGDVQQCLPSKDKEVEELDKVVEQVNEYYNGTRKTKICKLMKKYLVISWRVLTFLALVLVVLLMSLQTFCNFYDCRDVFKTRMNSNWSSPDHTLLLHPSS